MKRHDYIKLILVGAFLTTTAWAAAEQNPIYLHQLPWLSILIAGLLAMWGGATHTAMRHLNHREEYIWQLLRDMFIASGAGFVMFNLSMWAQFNIWLMAATIYTAGWLGARFLSAVGERLLDAVRNVGKKGPE